MSEQPEYRINLQILLSWRPGARVWRAQCLATNEAGEADSQQAAINDLAEGIRSRLAKIRDGEEIDGFFYQWTTNSMRVWYAMGSDATVDTSAITALSPWITRVEVRVYGEAPQ